MGVDLGQIIAGDFRLESRLSEGGMGEVFRAEQLSTGKFRAVKVMKAELARDLRFRERFELEAKAGARIASEHVVEVVAAGIDEPTGAPWLAMELLEGTDLATLVQERRKLPPDEVAMLFRQLCHALEAAHCAGLVHRDLKPQNLFVAKSRLDGVPFMLKVLDFGIAKLLVDAPSTEQTDALGTPMWMAPEQVETTDGVTHAADIWPLGLMAYFALTGRAYWRAASAGSSMTALLREVLLDPIEAPSKRLVEQGLAGDLLPSDFDVWFMRCVDRDPKARFQSVGDAVSALCAVLSDAGATPPVTEDLATANTLIQPSRTLPPKPATAAGSARTLPSPDGEVLAKDRTPHVSVKSTPAPPRRGKWRNRATSAALAAIAVVAIGGGFAYRRLRTAPRTPTTTDPPEKRVGALLAETFSSVRSEESPIRIGDGDLVLGDDKALVGVVLFCGWTDDECVRLSKEVDLARAHPASHVTVAYASAVPRNDPDARLAAQAVTGVYDSAGPEAFSKFKDVLFAHRGEVTRTNVVQWARAAGVLDTDTFAKRIDEGRWLSRVAKTGDVAGELRLARSTLLANCRVVRRADEITAEAHSVTTELLALDARPDPVARALGLQMYDPYPYHCGESAKAASPFGISPLPSVARSPFSSEGSDEAARETIARYFAARPRQDSALYGIDVVVDDDAKGSRKARVKTLVREKGPPRGKAHVALFELSIEPESGENVGWKVRSESTKPMPEASCEDSAVALALTTDAVSRVLLEPPGTAEKSAGCIARAALIEPCHSHTCSLSIACLRSDSYSPTRRVHVDTAIPRVTMGPDDGHMFEIDTTAEARAAVARACLTDASSAR